MNHGSENSGSYEPLTFEGKVLAIILAVPVYAAAVALNGWSLSLLWKWFMSSVFGLPELSVGQCLGLIVLSWCVIPHVSRAHEEKLSFFFFKLFGSPLARLGVGWLILKFM